MQSQWFKWWCSVLLFFVLHNFISDECIFRSIRVLNRQTLQINTFHYSHLQMNAKSKKKQRSKIKTTKATLFHVSLNIFICDKDNILVLQDITQPFAMNTAKKHLHANV